MVQMPQTPKIGEEGNPCIGEWKRNFGEGAAKDQLPPRPVSSRTAENEMVSHQEISSSFMLKIFQTYSHQLSVCMFNLRTFTYSPSGSGLGRETQTLRSTGGSLSLEAEGSKF